MKTGFITWKRTGPKRASEARSGEDRVISHLPDRAALQALLQALERSSLGCAVLLDEEQVYANGALARIFGYDLEALRHAPSDFLRDGRARFTTSIVRDDGTTLPIEVSLSHTRVEDARATIVLVRDASSSAALEAALEEAEERFRAERAQLEAELMKRDRLSYVGTLAAGVAHELNNPLTSLAMQARKLREQADAHGLGPEAKLAIEHIDEGARRMTAVISDLLFMARPVGRPQSHVDVRQVLLSTVALLRAGIPNCPEVLVDIDELPALCGYPSKLGQVFFNVLRNAMQAIEGRPGGAIRVRGRATGDMMFIEIEDDGAGIPPEVMARVTQPFVTTKPDGSGLGLWISQALLDLHGGKLDIASEVGKGTRVAIQLPVGPPETSTVLRRNSGFEVREIGRKERAGG
jgi:signal transduction histidine kinase